MELKEPEVSFSKNYLDFGPGFYLTTFQNRAEKWAKRKSLRKKGIATVNVYELNGNLNNYRVLRFLEENDQWLDFICACRKGEDVYKDYDVIIGSVADDDVFRTVDFYFRGIWSKEKALEELRYYKMNDQICILNQKVIDENLKFLESYEVRI